MKPSLKPIVAYLAIAFGLAYAIEIPWVLNGARFDDGADTAANFGLSLLLWIPAIAAWITRQFVEKAPRVRPKLPRPVFILSTIFVPPLVFGVVYALSAACGFVSFEGNLQSMTQGMTPDALKMLPPKAIIMAGALFASITFGLLFSCLTTLGEELGWTGFLLPRLLQHYSPQQSALMYGAAWGVWYAPLVYGGYNYPKPWLGILLMIAFCMAVAQVLTAVWLRTRTVLGTTLMHATLNGQSRGLWPLLFPTATLQVMLGGVAGVIGIVVIGLIGIAWLRVESRNPVA